MKLNEICNILNKQNIPNVYYLITLRNDTFTVLESKIAKQSAGYDVNLQNIFTLERHNYTDIVHFAEIKNKRFEALKLSFKEFPNTLYSSILKHIFTKYEETDENLINTHQIRMLLRNMLFVSLQIYFEFKRRKEETFNEANCDEYIKRRFKETFFLRNYPFLETGCKMSSQIESANNIFPNIFYFHNENNDWISLCKIRILQYLEKNLSTKEDIERVLSIYDEETILQSIETLLDYNLIYISFKLSSIKYEITNKGRYFSKLINNLDVLYYLSLDTPLPEKFVTPIDDENNISYFSIFDKRLHSSINNSGYGNAIIKSVLTFILFLKYIHEQELITLEQNLSKLEVSYFKFPIKINEIEKDMKKIYKELVQDKTKINDYFKHIGFKEDLDANLKHFDWIE